MASFHHVRVHYPSREQLHPFELRSYVFKNNDAGLLAAARAAGRR